MRVPQERPRCHKRTLGAILGPLGRLLRGSWEHLGGICGVFWSYFGVCRVFSKRSSEVMKKHQKRCKVLHKSRFDMSKV